MKHNFSLYGLLTIVAILGMFVLLHSQVSASIDTTKIIDGNLIDNSYHSDPYRTTSVTGGCNFYCGSGRYLTVPVNCEHLADTQKQIACEDAQNHNSFVFLVSEEVVSIPN